MSRPQKRSLTLRGHATSVSLEAEFWRAFRRIAADRALSVSALAAEIDARRDLDTGLASAIRVFVLTELERRLDQRAGGIE
ncbi:MAG: ribbon-helix-helix domain-containing protein [Alkalilacustris sp.]